MSASDRPLLSNARSDRVREVSALGRRSARARSGRFLVEGPQAVRELLRYAGGHTRALYVTAEAGRRHAEILDAAREAEVPTWMCTDEVLSAMADTGSPQGVLAVAEQVDVPLDQALDAVGPRDFAVVLTHVRDPGNAGTVLRGASAFGAAAVLLSAASVDVHHPKVVRSTVGALFHLPVSVGTPVQELLEACRARGIRLLAADGAGEVPLPDADLGGPHAWVLGNEAWGMPADVLAACDVGVSIPIERAESLNLAMAATVCLHASAAASTPGP
ncbi:RNA methyltransferase [Serinicoccus chungangensis]|uniref:RNA methyltransferase n=1 Tax=Serinicoccus chungangensis TaxID=767452 RepID=A0A0W8I161_9MICO|nr:RNA methyltransferase [Serinicoccus chungangensis]KUG51446.1 RNA methyltransferase [Serinicoccus chungangensis]